MAAGYKYGDIVIVRRNAGENSDECEYGTTSGLRYPPIGVTGIIQNIFREHPGLRTEYGIEWQPRDLKDEIIIGAGNLVREWMIGPYPPKEALTVKEWLTKYEKQILSG